MATLLQLDRSRRNSEAVSPEINVFSTKLGWIAMATRDHSLVRLVFGYPNARAAREGVAEAMQTNIDAFGRSRHTSDSTSRRFAESLKRRLSDFAEGEADDLLDIPVADDDWTPFQRRVLNRCRRIPYGETLAYAELAAAAGSPGAARAVGRAMATNPVPLVIPCHRVVGSSGDLRGFSAVGGLGCKRHLLDLEKSRRSPRSPR